MGLSALTSALSASCVEAVFLFVAAAIGASAAGTCYAVAMDHVIWSTLRLDVRYALRALRHSPLFTAVAVTSLALGIGANTTTFTLANAILLRSLPVRNPQELVVLASNPAAPTTASNYPDYLSIRDHSRSYAGLIALWSGGVTRFSLPESNGAAQLIALSLVSGNYFEVLGVPPALGRVFNPSDNVTPGAHPYVVLSYEIVGVVGNAHYESFDKAPAPMIYRPFYREMMWTGGTLCIRTLGDPNRIVGAIRRRAQEIDPFVVVTEVRTLEDNLDRALLQQRFVATLGAFFGAVALLLATVGIYGVMSQAVTRRTREIGIRMALGAAPGTVLRMMLRESLAMLAIGALIGLPAALALTKYTKSLLFGVKPQDPVTLAAAVVLLLMAATLAAFHPARRAMRVQPVEALKQE